MGEFRFFVPPSVPTVLWHTHGPNSPRTIVASQEGNQLVVLEREDDHASHWSTAVVVWNSLQPQTVGDGTASYC